MPAPSNRLETPPTGPHPGPRSVQLFDCARHVFPDGTTRVTIERDPTPCYAAGGEGAYLLDVDGERYLDLNGNFTTLIHGHGFAPVASAVERQLRNGSCFANPTEAEIALGKLLCERVPRLERIRFVNTGTEAVMFAIKAARAYTGRSAIATIEGAYHGAYDWVEVTQASTPDNWGPPHAPSSVPSYRGMPASVLEETVVLRFNDADSAVRLLETNAERLAAVVIDPIPSRAGLVAPEPAFVSALQETARALGILLISDEVLSFRLGYRGAASRFSFEPDLLALGKIIGGGFPIGAVGGRAEIMSVFDARRGRPLLPQGGTFSANPISMVAGRAAMVALDQAAFVRLEDLGDRLRMGLEVAARRADAPFSVTGAASLFRIHPRPTPPREFREAYCRAAEARVMKEMSRFFRRNGLILPDGAAACLSTPMGEAEIEKILSVFEAFLATRGWRDGEVL